MELRKVPIVYQPIDDDMDSRFVCFRQQKEDLGIADLDHDITVPQRFLYHPPEFLCDHDVLFAVDHTLARRYGEQNPIGDAFVSLHIVKT